MPQVLLTYSIHYVQPVQQGPFAAPLVLSIPYTGIFFSVHHPHYIHGIHSSPTSYLIATLYTSVLYKAKNISASGTVSKAKGSLTVQVKQEMYFFSLLHTAYCTINISASSLLSSFPFRYCERNTAVQSSSGCKHTALFGWKDKNNFWGTLSLLMLKSLY